MKKKVKMQICVRKYIKMSRVRRKKPVTSTSDSSQRGSVEADDLWSYPLQQHKATDNKFRG